VLDDVTLTPMSEVRPLSMALEQIGIKVARNVYRRRLDGGAVNLPQLQVPIRALATRFIQIQRNLPGMLGLNDVLGRRVSGLTGLAARLSMQGCLGLVYLMTVTFWLLRLTEN
jgi:hypothetical protein